MEKYPGTQYLATDDQIIKLSLAVDDHNNDVAKVGTNICQFCDEIMDSNVSLEIHSLNVHGKFSTKEDAEIMVKKEGTGKIYI